MGLSGNEPGADVIRSQTAYNSVRRIFPMRFGMALLVTLLTTLGIPEKPFDGNGLLARCTTVIDPSDQTDRLAFADAASCFAFIRGFLNGHTAAVKLGSAEPLICAPGKLSVLEARRVVVEYLEDHPEKLHEPDGVLVYYALREAFPCPPSDND
jgi:hypothetical protein